MKAKAPQTKPCDMPSCPRQVALDVTFCKACRSWHYYWRKRPLAAWADYSRRIELAESRIERRGKTLLKNKAA